MGGGFVMNWKEFCYYGRSCTAVLIESKRSKIDVMCWVADSIYLLIKMFKEIALCCYNRTMSLFLQLKLLAIGYRTIICILICMPFTPCPGESAGRFYPQDESIKMFFNAQVWHCSIARVWRQKILLNNTI